MSDQLHDRPATEQVGGLRSLRQIISGPTQHAVDELRKSVARLHDDVHTPEELTKLLVPIITDVFRKKVSLSAKDVTEALAPIIDTAFAERTRQDKHAIVQSLAPTVAKALREQHDKFPDEIAEDLAPLMGTAIREQVREQRDAMVDALYPIIGATIAKYMAETLRELIENINKKIERSFTFRGISRRMKARAMGVSEAELILQESLPFTVHAVFLIHKSSGLLITEARNPRGRTFDSDLVSGMLTAIRSFVNDWIAKSGEVSEIHSIEYGMSHIMLEVAGNCYLAVVIEGEPSHEYIGQIRNTLSNIVATSDKMIAAFDGNQSTVATSVRHAVQTLLQPESHSTSKPRRSTLATAAILMVVVVLMIGIPLAWRWQTEKENTKKEEQARSALAKTLGLARNPVDVRVDGNTLELFGELPNELLKRRAAEIVQRAMPTAIVENAIVVPGFAAHPLLLLAEVERVTTVFNNLHGVRLSPKISKANVTLFGVVGNDTLMNEIISAIEQLPGVASVSFVKDQRTLAIPFTIQFAKGFTEIPETEIQKVHMLTNLLNMFPNERIKIIGHSDNDGSKARNVPITLGRAVAVKDLLVQAGIADSRLEVEGEGASVPGLEPRLPENRCVRFVILPRTDPSK